MYLLAEIADKMPSIVGIATVSTVLALLTVILGKLRWWCGFVFVPFLGFWNYLMWAQLHEPAVGYLIIEELGYAYVVKEFVATDTPFLVATLLLLLERRRQLRQKRATRGLCPSCGYDLRGASRLESNDCPECGSTTT